jgi:hypothetical protein
LRLKYVEMLELIGRYAEHKLKGSCFEVEPLQKKIEITLDQILPLSDLARVVAEEKKEGESTGESESDY